MHTVVSRDGTTIAYDVQGAGPALVLVLGALSARTSDGVRKLTERLAPHFTVYTYDRRGRGDSGDTAPYAVAREVEDLAAIIDAAGGTAALYGHSSGAALVLEAALALGPAVTRVALYEVPYNDDPEARRAWRVYIARLTACLTEGRRSDALALFMGLVGMSAEQLAGLRQSPAWPTLEALAPTLAYDHTSILGADAAVPAGRFAGVGVPALVMYGDASYPFMRDTAVALGEALPRATVRVLAGQQHGVDPVTLAPVLADFLGDPVGERPVGGGAMEKHASHGLRRYLVAPALLLLAALPALRALGALGLRPVASWRGAARHALALMYASTASAHFTRRRADLIRMVPPWVPAPRLAVALTGGLELLGAAGLLAPATAPLAGRGLAALLVVLLPANAHAARRGIPLGGKPATPLGFRTLAQGLFVTLTLWASAARPWGRRAPDSDPADGRGRPPISGGEGPGGAGH